MAENNAQKPEKTEMTRGKQQKRALKAVSIIKGGMFVIESITGYLAHSNSMIADSADMLEDTLGAAASLIVHDHSPRTQAFVAVGKATVMAALGLGVLGSAVFTLLNPAMLPVAATMGIVGSLGLAANAACASLIYRFRKDDINMMAAWKCLRNDMASNAGVLIAAGLSHFFTSSIPDLVIGSTVAALCVKSAIDIFREAIPILRATRKDPAKKPARQRPRRHLVPGLSPKVSAAFQKTLGAIFRRSAAKPAAQTSAPALPAPSAQPSPLPPKTAPHFTTAL